MVSGNVQVVSDFCLLPIDRTEVSCQSYGVTTIEDEYFGLV